MSYDVRDNSGRKIGTARPIGQSSGCGCIIALGVILILGGGFLAQAIYNFANYHIFTLDTGGARSGATATAIAPYKIYSPIESAKRGGKTSSSMQDGGPAVILDIGGSLTFDGINAYESGLYYLCFGGRDQALSGNGMIIDIIVNGKLIKFDTGKNGFGGSGSPVSCESNIIVQLNKGANSIKIKNDDSNQCIDTGCPSVFLYYGLSADKKFN